MTVEERSPDLNSLRAVSIYPDGLPDIEGIIPELFPSGPWHPEQESARIWPREFTSSEVLDNAGEVRGNSADKKIKQAIGRMLDFNGIVTVSMGYMKEIRVLSDFNSVITVRPCENSSRPAISKNGHRSTEREYQQARSIRITVTLYTPFHVFKQIFRLFTSHHLQNMNVKLNMVIAPHIIRYRSRLF
jgi:hypothetical protein